jgi:hypothetical protein
VVGIGSHRDPDELGTMTRQLRFNRSGQQAAKEG